MLFIEAVDRAENCRRLHRQHQQVMPPTALSVQFWVKTIPLYLCSLARFVVIEDFSGYRLYRRLGNVSSHAAANFTCSLLSLASHLPNFLLRLLFRVAREIACFIFQLGASFLPEEGANTSPSATPIAKPHRSFIGLLFHTWM